MTRSRTVVLRLLLPSISAIALGAAPSLAANFTLLLDGGYPMDKGLYDVKVADLNLGGFQ
jgi:hypothetical protein